MPVIRFISITLCKCNKESLVTVQIISVLSSALVIPFSCTSLALLIIYIKTTSVITDLILPDVDYTLHIMEECVQLKQSNISI